MHFFQLNFSWTPRMAPPVWEQSKCLCSAGSLCCPGMKCCSKLGRVDENVLDEINSLESFIPLSRLTLRKAAVNWGSSICSWMKTAEQTSPEVLHSSEQPNYCYCLFWQTLSLPVPKHPSTSGSTWPSAWEELNRQRFESLLNLNTGWGEENKFSTPFNFI